MKFVNPNKENYHHRVIREFSESSRPLSSGVAKGYNTTEYSWVADLLFKNTGNLSINPHIGYYDFVSNRDIAYQEYGNIEEVYSNYPFFSEWVRNVLSDNSYELSNKQYSRIGQRYSEYDLIQYVNESENINYGTSGGEGQTTVNHKFYRAPGYAASGYVLNMEENSTAVYLKNYLFMKSATVESILTEKEYSYTLPAFGSEYSSDTIVEPIISSFEGDPQRLFDYKLDVDNKFSYFDEGKREWVMYYNDTEHYSKDAYYPYYGAVQFYSIPSEDNSTGKYFQKYLEEFDGRALFFPEVVQRGVLEPAKIIADWVSDNNAPNGAMSFNPSNHLGQADDQSRIVYNICRRQIKLGDPNTYNVNDDFYGIDIDTERNRRYSAVIMTEPYMVVDPIAGGELVDYYFVDKDNNPVTFADGADFISRPDIFLKIRAPLHVFTEVDQILSEQDINYDIINTITIKDPLSHLADFNGSGQPYENFGSGSLSTFFSRQDNCLDDLVDGKIGTGKRYKFYIDYISGADDRYSDSEIKVNGMGFVSKTVADSSGNITGIQNELNLYCSNYVAINNPDEESSDSEATIPNEAFKILVTTSNISGIKKRESFKPMIKMPGMNGYIKIMARNLHFKTTRSSDGRFEMTFNVEFPYCPGSYSNRVDMDYSSSVNTGFIYRKRSHIRAGSHEAYEVSGERRYDAYNDRYAPFRDDSFTNHTLLKQIASSGYVYTDPSTKGGSFVSPLSVPKKRIRYPADLVWERIYDWKLFSLYKSTLEDFEQYGTYEIRLSEESVEANYSTDFKLVCIADNRQWRFNQDNYSSYIGRENPSFVCQIDISTLQKDFTLYQKDHGSIPDTKRWLSAYFSGFAHVMQTDLDEDVLTEKISTIGNPKDLTTQESKSDFIIEVWDSEADLGNGKKGNWRPFLYNGFDYSKIPNKLVVDNIYFSNAGSSAIAAPGNIWEAYVGYSDILSIEKFPEYVDYGGDGDILDAKSNLILYDVEDNKAFHIAYVEKSTDPLNPGSEVYKIFFRYDPLEDGPLKSLLDVENPPYQILDPKRVLSKDTRFSFSSLKAASGTEGGFLTRFIDIRDEVESPSDMDRYAVDDKITFRVRVLRNKDFPTSFINKDSSELVYLGDIPYDSGEQTINNPWYNSSEYDKAFDWSKIRVSEEVRKLGIGYFRCSSK